MVPNSSLNPPPYANESIQINEIEATTEIGAMLGFEIDANNELLAGILGVPGETTTSK